MTPSTASPGTRPGRDDTAWPRRPLLTALWIPAAAVLLPVGGAVCAFGGWSIAPGVALVVTGGIGLMWALSSLCRPKALRWVTLSLVFGPLIAVPLLALNTTQDTVLAARGVTRSAEITDVRVSHGKTTTYSCTVRFTNDPGRSRRLTCGSYQTVGQQVLVTEDPDDLVDPKLGTADGSGRFDLALTLFFEAALLIVATLGAGIGALLHRRD